MRMLVTCMCVSDLISSERVALKCSEAALVFCATRLHWAPCNQKSCSTFSLTCPPKPKELMANCFWTPSACCTELWSTLTLQMDLQPLSFRSCSRTYSLYAHRQMSLNSSLNFFLSLDMKASKSWQDTLKRPSYLEPCSLASQTNFHPS